MTTKTTWILGPLTVIALALSGCGDDSSGSSAASDTSAPSAGTTSPPNAGTTSAAAAALMEQIPSPFVEKPQLERTFLGAVDDSDAYVAVVTSGSDAVAFLCDGHDMWMWMSGEMDGDRLALTAPDGSTLTGTMSDGKVSGTVTGAGMTDKAFEAEPAAADEGLFRATTDHDGADYTLGWIMSSDGVRGLERRADGSSTGGIAVDHDDMDDRNRDRRQERRDNDQAACQEMGGYNDWLAAQPQTPPVSEMMSMNSMQMEGC
ncbi:hypothetical protein [Rhodococcus tibetensis]|uniref:Lipoprotein n=1 Tax=Rhodococcus tibetensis TaxID=2965064 RepID=A0ABT1Q746_9NOCA|nr:hypothetical protein [Rhodococcus sp. FXJ9.536]MCQ4118074.1 hypothetical protein [Rhodococcus sp. FXJ9.536]